MDHHSQRGVSLLEILLVVLIAGIIISAAVSYYSQVAINRRVAQAAALIQQFNKAGYEWRQIPNTSGIYPSDFSGLNSASDGNGITLFNQLQLLSCENNNCYKNPWGGANSVSVNTFYPQYMMVIMDRVPVADCHRLQQQMANIGAKNFSLQNTCTNLTSKISTYQIYL